MTGLRMSVRLALCLRSAGLSPAFLAAVLLLYSGAPPWLRAGHFEPATFLEDVKQLSSERFRGRLTGTAESREAANWIAEKFRDAGLQPVIGGSYFQQFRVTTRGQAGSGNQLSYRYGDRRVSLKLHEEFVPLNFSSSGRVSGPLVFAGYGITAPEYGYDDYRGLDVRGKLVLVLRNEPQQTDENSIFGGRVYTNHAMLEVKARNAARRGALALLLVDDVPASRSRASLEMPGQGIAPDSPGIPVVEIKPAVAEGWFHLAGLSFAEVLEEIDEDLKPRSFHFPPDLTVELQVKLTRQTSPALNVLGLLPGTTEEFLVIAAHYDHIGLGQQFTMEPSRRGHVHPGADDNASGVAGLLALARYFAARPPLRRGLLFAAFAGEEFGLIGSNYFVRNPSLSLSRAVAMINLDMIGRLRDNKLYVGGTHSSPGFRSMVYELNRSLEEPFVIEDDDTGDYGSSDHFVFSSAQIPFLFFFTGMHPDYHTPSDTWDRIEAREATRILELVARVIERLAEAPSRPLFQNAASGRARLPESEPLVPSR